MKEETIKTIKFIAQFIDKDKNNFLVISRNYDLYLEKILTDLVKTSIELEKGDKI